MQPGLILAELDGNQFLANLEACAGVYAAAMNPPEDQLPGRHTIMERHSGYAAFRAIAAIVRPAGGAPAGGAAPAGGDGQGDSELVTGDLVGFAYGFHGGSGQWWHDLVSRTTASILGSRAADDWFGDSLEIAEVHVLPSYQGRGTGLAMMLRLTAGRPERAAVLSTMDANTRARRLYRGLGFTDLLTSFTFPGTELPYAIMGAPLPLPGAPARSALPDRPSR
ncbi:MAG TPA: GNAT family N-acetyltransferase [Streptosporangiaceae bacterium]|nr:GNAT family N-acetyltransferase [Streptosporangiaceae bacterium]